jgi:hypothetical protein
VSDDVNTSGLIGDVIDAYKRTKDEAKKRAAEEAERLRRKYVAAKRERMLRLVLFGAIVYLVWSD